MCSYVTWSKGKNPKLLGILKKKKSLFHFGPPICKGWGAEFTQAGAGRVNLHKILPENTTTWDDWTILFAAVKMGGFLLLPLCSPLCVAAPSVHWIWCSSGLGEVIHLPVMKLVGFFLLAFFLDEFSAGLVRGSRLWKKSQQSARAGARQKHVVVKVGCG